MIKLRFLLILALFWSQFTWSQSMGKVTLVDSNVDPFGVLDDIKPPPPGLEGSVYYSDEWKPGSIYLNNGTRISNYPLKYDLEQNHVELKAYDSTKFESQIKVCSWNRFDRFEFYEGGDTLTFINSNNIKMNDDVPLVGIFQLSYHGKISLLAFPYLKILDPNYAPTVDVGSRNNKAVQRTSYYLLKDDRAYLFKNRKDLIQLLENNGPELEKFIKKQKLKTNREEDLIRIFSHYESLSAKGS